ncbi:MAG: riboflavin kinase [Patescibacteria group bacterium]
MGEVTLITGTVQRSSGLGHTLGFPTANLELDPGRERPRDGIYACWVEIENEGQRWAGALHVGPRPAVGKAAPSIEVHILDFPDQDLTGKHLALHLVKRLRDVKNFASLEELKVAIAKDCEEARLLLTSPSAGAETSPS